MGRTPLSACLQSTCVKGLSLIPADIRLAGAELELVENRCRALGVNVALSEVWAKGGEGGVALAEEVIRLCDAPNHFTFSYELNCSIKEKIEAIAKRVYHADGEELLVRVRREDGLECCYGNLAESLVSVGDWVTTGQLLGTRLPETAATLEVRRDGYSVDPTEWIQE